MSRNTQKGFELEYAILLCLRSMLSKVLGPRIRRIIEHEMTRKPSFINQAGMPAFEYHCFFWTGLLLADLDQAQNLMFFYGIFY